MAKILDRDKCKEEIVNIVSNARYYVALISPYLGDQDVESDFNDVFDLVNKRASDNVKVQVFTLYPKCQRKPLVVANVINRLKSLPNVLVHSDSKDFHMKCYFNEDEVLISSMNLSNRSKLEMGVLISKEWDSSLYLDTMRLVNLLCEQMGMTPIEESELRKPLLGYCIRCGNKISHDPSRPLCNYCYTEWAYWGNALYPESFCHSCGKQFKSSYYRPLCKSCL